MRSLKKMTITLLFLAAAIACYAVGVPVGGVIFLTLGLVFEGMFWIRLFGRDRSKSSGIEVTRA